MLSTLFYILLFAIATVIIYIWGIKKEQSREKELLDNLYKKVKKLLFAPLNKIKLYLEKISKMNLLMLNLLYFIVSTN